MKKLFFSAELMKIPDMDAAYICIPDDVHKNLGGKRRMKVRALIDGAEYRGSIMDMGLGMMLGVTQEIRRKINKNPGDIVSVEISEDLQERVVEIPDDLASLLKKNPAEKEFFDSLSFTNRKEYARWITDAKREETRSARLQKIIEFLNLKRKNPTDKGL